MNRLLKLCFLLIALPTNNSAQVVLSKSEGSVSSVRCTGTILSHKGLKGKSIKRKGEVQVEAIFYTEADTFVRYATTDADGRFAITVPKCGGGRIKVGFNTYRQGKPQGFLVELDRKDGRRATDKTAVNYVCIQDSAGYDGFLYDMQRESELCLLRGEKIDYMPKWLVKQQPVKTLYHKERRALAWSCNNFSIHKSPLFKYSWTTVKLGARVGKYHYNLLAYPASTDNYESGIIEFGGPRVWMNGIDKLYVSTAPFPIDCIYISQNDDEPIRMQLQKNIAPYKPIGVYYKRMMPMVYIEDNTFYTYLDLPL